MRRYLFSFEFERYTRNHYLRKFLMEQEIDFFSHYASIYADLFGEDIYYKLECEHVVKDSWDVYYAPDKIQKRSGLERKYPLRGKVIRVEDPCHMVKVTFSAGDSVTTSIRGDKDKVLEFYLNKNHLFNIGVVEDNLQQAVKVEFIA